MITLTIGINNIWQPSQGQMLEELRESFPGLSIISVERPIFSGRYAVTLESANGMTDAELRQVFIFALQGMGYEGEVLAIDSGAASSNPGGIGQATAEAAKAASGALIPLAIIAVVVVIIIYIPKPRR
jgi:hypothetical protein